MGNERNYVMLTVRMQPNARRNLRVQAAKKEMPIAKYLEYLVNKDIAEEKGKEQEDE